MGSCEDQQHAKDHGVTCDTVCFRVVNLKCCYRAKLGSLNVEEADKQLDRCSLGNEDLTYLT